MTTAIHVAVFALLPYLVPVAVPMIAAWVSWKGRPLSPWLLALLLSPFGLWLSITFLTSRASSLANLSFEPRLLGLIVATAFLPQFVTTAGTSKDEKRRFFVALACCALIALWLGATFPELRE